MAELVSASVVDLSLWTTDKAALVAQIGAAARDTGFLQVYNHGIPQEAIDAAFGASRAFFALPDADKARTPFVGWAGGWEKEQQARGAAPHAVWRLGAALLRLDPRALCAVPSQVRPSTGTADLKESFQIGYTEAAQASWPAEELAPGFRPTCQAFMAHAAAVSDVLLRALALALDMPEDELAKEHDPKAPDVQTRCAARSDACSCCIWSSDSALIHYSLRLLHYPGLDPARSGEQAGRWRAGAHTDFDVLTLLFQRPGEGGLEVCPGRLASNEFAYGDTWLPVPPIAGCITCNIGDMLMRWSDDRVVSTFHRVRAPAPDEPNFGASRYSIAYFNQARCGTVIAGASGKYEALTGREFMEQSIKRNFAAYAAR